MTTWFTADHHFGHANIIEYCSRPFKTTRQMDDELIRRWNSVVRPDDTVYYVGDFTLGSYDDACEYFKNLNGKVFVLEGSHDRWMSKTGFSPNTANSVVYYLPPVYTVEFQGKKMFQKSITLCHYAMRSWDRSHYATWHLFGHHHGKLLPYGLSFDIGVDCWDFYPVSLEQVAEKMTTLKPIVDYSKKR